MGKNLPIALLIAGLVTTVLVILAAGFAAVYHSVAMVGIGGFAALCCYALLPLSLSASAWSHLLPCVERVQFRYFVLARLVRDSASSLSLMPAASTMTLAARAMIARGVLPAYAVASVAVDATTQALGQIAFLVLGVVLCLTRPEERAELVPIETVAPALLLVALAGGITLLMVFDKHGGRLGRNLYRYAFPSIEIDDSFRGAKYELYASYDRLALAAALHLAAWIASGIGTYIALRLMGSGIHVQDALAIEAFACAIRTLGGGVPAALGVQEAGYALLSILFGQPAEFGVAVSLLRRGREFLTAVPALLYWRITSGGNSTAKAH